MKVIRLKSENVMRLVAVDITPEGNMVIVGGKNGAGKSSVLDSLAMALGGAQLAPQEPIRTGEAEAKIEVDLGDLKVTRRFTREMVEDLTQPRSHFGEGPIGKKWGETKSTLTVTNKEGAKYPSPQAMLDKLLGKLTFDPLAFANEGKTSDGKKRQAETLRRVVNLDTSQIENLYSVAYAQRAMLKKTRDIKEAQALALPKHEGVPADEVPMDAISQEMLKAEELRKVAEDAEREWSKRNEHKAQLVAQLDRSSERIGEMRRQLQSLEDQHLLAIGALDARVKELEAAKVTAEAARAAVPDVAVVRAKLSEVEATNAKVRANRKHAEALAEVAELAGQIDAETKAVDGAVEAKRRALEAVAFPVAGLGLNEDGVTYGGLPFSQASSSEQLRVSVAIGLALNPTLKVLLIRSGNLLDDDSLKLVAEQADKAEAQVWVEWVTADPEGVSVFIEDGRVAEVAEPA